MKISAIGNTPAFGRKPNSKEMEIYTSSLNQGLQILDKQVDLILHNASAPAVKNENTGIGSLFSRTTASKLIPFLKEHAFSHIQQEPNNLRQAMDNSPYAPEADTKNIFMIPLEKLASNEYGYILSRETFNKIIKNNPDPVRVDYDYVRKNYDIALKEAFNNLKENEKLNTEFLKFKKLNEGVYEQSAIYRILCKENNNKNWQDWKGIDKELYTDTNSQEAKSRIAELKEKHKEEYDLYLFEQMILEKENQKSNKLSKKTGISIIGDSPVASSAVEEWVNQKLFLKDKALGCPPDFFSPEGQRWGFKYYDPDKIFNKDGTLGEAGKIMQKKYENYFASFPGGVRIDHIIGLIDPFIYTVSEKMTPQNSGRIYTNSASKYHKDGYSSYADIMSKIILPSAKKYGLDKSSIICEDLGEVTNPVKWVMKKLGLGGISVTQFGYRGGTAPEANTIMIGSHDNKSFLEYVDDLFKNYKSEEFLNKTKYLAFDTVPKGTSRVEIRNIYKSLREDKLKFINASFTELFASPAKRVQIFFTDLFGIAKTYNRPGTTEGNWSLRLGEDFEKDYYTAVSKGIAPNFPKAIAEALRHRGLDKDNEDLMKNLENSAKILQEK